MPGLGCRATRWAYSARGYEKKSWSLALEGSDSWSLKFLFSAAFVNWTGTGVIVDVGVTRYSGVTVDISVPIAIGAAALVYVILKTCNSRTCHGWKKFGRRMGVL